MKTLGHTPIDWFRPMMSSTIVTMAIVPPFLWIIREDFRSPPEPESRRSILTNRWPATESRD